MKTKKRKITALKAVTEVVKYLNKRKNTFPPYPDQKELMIYLKKLKQQQAYLKREKLRKAKANFLDANDDNLWSPIQPGRETQQGGSKRILHNKVKCLCCGDIIESKYRHDFVSCTCGHISVDGGLDYLRRVWVGESKNYIELSEME